jgi:cysteine-rich repeat protein
VAAVALVAMTAGPAVADAVKDSIKCRGVIAQQAVKMVKDGLKIVEQCHDKRNNAKRTLDTDCNDLAVADLKDKFPTNGQKAADKVAAKIDKKCAGGEIVRLNYPDGDIDEALLAVVQARVESSGASMQGAPNLTDKKADKLARKCHKEIGKGRTKIVNDIVKNATKCQKKLDKSALAFGELAADCFFDPSKAVASAVKKIDKKCARAGIAGGDVGSCEPLPACVVDDAKETGAALARAIYGTPPECGNGLQETGEACDDGNLDDGDGCDSNCTPTGCGNGVITAPETCDDGNAIDTDGCALCQPATCEDGFVHAGVELCGDGAAVCPFDSATCPQGDCVFAGGGPTVSVSFAAAAPVGALKILLDYPEDVVGLPGFGQDAAGRVSEIPAGLNVVNDEDYALRVSVTAFGGAIPAGRFFTAAFDVCDGAAPVTLGQLACIVEEAFDVAGVDAVAATCTVSIAP